MVAPTGITKSLFGGELALGYERPLAYFQRFSEHETRYEYFNFNRLSIQVSSFFYLVKEAKLKWDIQVGVCNYFNLYKSVFLPELNEVDTWKITSLFGTNITYKSFLIRLFYEYNLKADYCFGNPQAVFGMRLGIIYGACINVFWTCKLIDYLVSVD